MIYIIRHGQTIWNLKSRKQGRKDSPLTIKGLQQAKDLSGLLSRDIDNVNDFKIFVSPLFRTRQFASLICEYLGLDFDYCIEDDRLMEHSFGLWEGLTDNEIEFSFPGMAEERYSNWWDYVVPMGESYKLIADRAKNFLSDISEDDDIIIITHEMISKVTRGNYLGLSNEDTLKLNHPQNTIYRLNNKNQETLK